MTTSVSKWTWGPLIWLLPGLTTLIYFQADPPSNQILYVFGKLFYLSLPLYFYFKTRKFPWKFSSLEGQKALILLAFTLAVFFSALIMASWIGWASPLFMTLGENLSLKLQDFGLRSSLGFWGVAIFTSFLNSFMEEIYWRWAAIEKLTPLWGKTATVLLTAFFFSFHHIAALHSYLGWSYFSTTLAFSFATSIGALFWSWLYLKTKNLFWCWVSHILIDISIMYIGYQILSKNSFL